jgi:cell division protein FtsB
MKLYKKIGWPCLLALEVVLFFGNYFIADNGFPAIMAMQQENSQLLTEIGSIKNDLHMLEEKLIAWHSCPYYQEKIAREQLHMARKDESIYYVS